VAPVIDVDGSRLAFERFTPDGEPDGRNPVVLLHEGLGSVSAWGRFPAELAAATGRRVLAYDRRGYGRSSPWPGPWSASFLLDEAVVLGRVLVGLGVRRPVLVGHSDGASIALAYPARRPPGGPEPVGIVSLSAHVLVEAVSVDSIRSLRGPGRDELVSRLGRHQDRPDEVFEAWSEVWTSDRFRSWTLEAELGAITCPVLAVQGAEDRFGSRLQLDRLVAGLAGPHQEHELAGVDHWPHREAPRQVLDLIADFCRLLP
jgi:pimeloyl-ACP methyl ester carboxylesterase